MSTVTQDTVEITPYWMIEEVYEAAYALSPDTRRRIVAGRNVEAMSCDELDALRRELIAAGDAQRRGRRGYSDYYGMGE